MTDPALRQILLDAARDLFGMYGVASELDSEGAMDDQTTCGILGFTGATICGSVVIAASREAIAATNPIEGSLPAQWLGELTNQIVGGFKNSLGRRGAEVWISLPVVLNATRLVPVSHGGAEPIHLRINGAPFTLWLETEGTVALKAACDDDTIREGEALLF